jgi:hypothetical protein
MKTYRFSPHAAEPPSSPGRNPLHALASVLKSMLLIAGGAHPKTIIDHCPPNEVLNVMIRGLALLASCSFTGFSLYAAATTVLNDGHFNIFILLASLGIGAFIGVIDNLALYRAPLFALGVAELANTGVTISTPTNYANLSGRIVRLRIGQGVVLGLLTGVFLMLFAVSSSIATRSDADFMAANKANAVEMSKPYDAQIGRATDAVAAQQGLVANLTRQISSLRQRMVGPQRQAASSANDSREAKFEKDLGDANTKLDGLKATLAKLVDGRNAAVMKAIESAPNRVLRREGFLGQLVTLQEMVADNPLLLLFLVPILLVSLGLDLAPVIAKSLYICSSYAAFTALDHFERVVKISHEGAERLAPYQREEQRTPGEPRAAGGILPDEMFGPPVPANDNMVHANENEASLAKAPPAEPAKRKRGRPTLEEVARRAMLNGQSGKPGDVA